MAKDKTVIFTVLGVLVSCCLFIPFVGCTDPNDREGYPSCWGLAPIEVPEELVSTVEVSVRLMPQGCLPGLVKMVYYYRDTEKTYSTNWGRQWVRQVRKDSPARIMASADTGFVFLHWESGSGGIISTSTTLSFETNPSDRSIVAVFTRP